MKKNIKDYLLDYILMEAALVLLWISIIYALLNKEFFIWLDLYVYVGITFVGTIVWSIGLIHEVKK